jgi:hypothetical protein
MVQILKIDVGEKRSTLLFFLLNITDRLQMESCNGYFHAWQVWPVGRVAQLVCALG